MGGWTIRRAQAITATSSKRSKMDRSWGRYCPGLRYPLRAKLDARGRCCAIAMSFDLGDRKLTQSDLMPSKAECTAKWCSK